MDCFIPLPKAALDVDVPNRLNNPFSNEVPAISRLAAEDLMRFISANESLWAHNFGRQNLMNESVSQGVKGKMFGVLVVQKSSGELGYIAAFSGNLLMNNHPNPFVPSVFDEGANDQFIHHGMKALSQLSEEIIKVGVEQKEGFAKRIIDLKDQRKSKSHRLQQKLFENYFFTNLSGRTENLVTIFSEVPHQRPAAGTGECAAPKLLEYALQNKLLPIAISEFWWGRSPKKVLRKHLSFYPACQNKCRFLLQYILQNDALYEQKV